MGHISSFVTKMGWGMISLLILLIGLFAVLHILRTSSLTSGNIVGQGAGWLGGHATNY
jgi:hypothetical protein